MPTHFEAPHIAEQFYQTSQNQEASRIQATLSAVGRLANRATLILGIVVGGGAATGAVSEMIDPSPDAAVAATGDYPDWNKPCVVGDPKDPGSSYGKTTGTGYWCNDYSWGDSYDEQNSSRGYGYRNCTDWVAFRIPQLIQKNVPTGWRNGGNWDNAASAAGYTVDTTPEPGDIAVWDPTKPGGYGHVEAVESVNEDGTANTSGYNKRQDGTYGNQNSITADHYIDLNGTGKGIGGKDIGSGGDTAPTNPSLNNDPKDDIAWHQGTTLHGLISTGTSFNKAAILDGMAPPTWAGTGDFTGDGRTDVAWYHSYNRFLYVASADENGNWSVRPKLGEINPPTWAGVSDFNKDGKDDIAWHAGTTISIMKSIGNTFDRPSPIRTGWASPDWADTGDYTGDGYADIVWYQAYNRTMYIIKSRADGVWQSGPVLDKLDAPQWADSGDFNADKKDDIAYFRNGTISILKSTGTGFNRPSPIRTGWATPAWAGMGDFNGSQREGIAWYQAYDQKLYLIKPDANGTWHSGVVMENLSEPEWAGVS
jgi:surface antigen